MALFPLFIDLAGRSCRVVGGGSVAARKIEQLLQFDAVVTVIGTITDAKIAALVSNATIAHRNRAYQTGDLTGCFLVIAATDDRAVNQQVVQDATLEGVWVNVADQPQECNFFFPALVKRGDLVIGVSTAGKAPALSKKLREHLECELPDDLGERLALLEQFRRRVQTHISDGQRRQIILNQVAQVAINGSFADLAVLIESMEKAEWQ